MRNLFQFLILAGFMISFQLSCSYRGEIYNKESPFYPDNQFQEVLHLNSIHAYILTQNLSEGCQSVSINDSNYIVITNGKDSSYFISNENLISNKYFNCIFRNENCFETRIIRANVISDSICTVDSVAKHFNPWGEALDYYEFTSTGVAYRSSPSKATAKKYDLRQGINFSFFYYPEITKKERDSLKSSFIHLRKFPEGG